MTTILVVPDGHARPEHDNSRFSALGNFIVDKRPDIIVNERGFGYVVRAES